MTPATGVALTMLPDFDHDGMSDWWETNYAGFSTNSLADAALDFDGDGLINRDEFIAGTNPTDASSVLKLALISTNGGAGLQFIAQSNISYAIQHRTNLGAAPWTTFTNIAPQPSVRTAEVAVPYPAQNAEKYYRTVTPAIP